jgi:hypothetical protein
VSSSEAPAPTRLAQRPPGAVQMVLDRAVRHSEQRRDLDDIPILEVKKLKTVR